MNSPDYLFDSAKMERLLADAEARMAERRKRRKPTAADAFARAGLTRTIGFEEPRVLVRPWEAQKERERFNREIQPFMEERRRREEHNEELDMDEEFDLSELSDWD